MEAEQSDSTCQNFARAAASNATPFSLNPLWMDYTLYNDRLRSFRYWNYNHVISGEHLAMYAEVGSTTKQKHQHKQTLSRTLSNVDFVL